MRKTKKRGSGQRQLLVGAPQPQGQTFDDLPIEDKIEFYTDYENKVEGTSESFLPRPKAKLK